MSGGKARADRQLAAQFAKRIRALEGSRRQVETLVSEGGLSSRAAGQVYEGLYINAFTAFEAFIEELFLGLLVGATARSSPPSVVPRVGIRSFSVAREVIFGPARAYVDWLPFQKTTERAKVFFRGGRPFTDVPASQVSVLDKAGLIRNVIAHRSRHSIRRFENDVVGSIPLAPRERSAAGFLRGVLAATPPQTRYESYVSNLVTVARQLTL